MHRLVWIIAAATTVLGNAVWAQTNSDFVVRNIRIEGLQRISDGAVYNYLPVDIGDELNERRIQEALRATYDSGFFSDVEMRRDGNTLVLIVRERPSIASFDITGNKDIKTEDLERSLKDAGLAPGLPFNNPILVDVEQSLTQEYFSRGKYAATVKTEVEELEDNRVKVAVKITEGDRAQIRQINVVGNTVFDDDELRGEMSLRTPNFLSWIRKDDRYSKEALNGDLETLTSYYMDRGYADFEVTSTQVAISPDKRDVFIDINVREGDIYTIDEVTLSGDLVVSEEELKQLILLKSGQIFSRKLMTSTNEFIQFRLGQEGFARAEVQPLPQINREEKTIDIDLRVIAGDRVYVRNINFKGTSSINDETLRREMRQMEGAWLSNTAVERSEERIRRLPYVEEVSSETVTVAGTPDLVDIEFEVEEGLPGQWGGGVGYSGLQGIILNGNFTHTNFLGTGNRVGLDINAGRYSKVYSLSHTDPYATPNGISRQMSISYRDITQFVSGSSDFSTETLQAGIDYGIPLSEYSSLRLGASYQDNELLVSGFSGSQQSIAFVNNNGDSFEVVNDNMSVCGTDPIAEIVNPDICGTSFNVFELFAGYFYDSRNRFLFPTRGMRHQLSVSMTVPGSKVEYYVASYNFRGLWPIWGDVILSTNLELAFGDALNATTDLPPFKNFFVGGPDSIRGFRQGQLGPIDSRGNPYGGNLKTLAQLELILPTPEKFRRSTRVSLFYDVGNAWYTGSTPFFDFGANPQSIDYDFDPSELRQSAGVALQWLAPLGTFKFSYAIPLSYFEGYRDASGNILQFSDELERFQFTIGRSF
ncbi:MAG: outer membrane protein assembly factor BamA [Gammaproteobacteria bacterium]|nr:outer membrane protein assembly factor BamA [Gammaproteobacteria bacterium]